MRIFYFSLMALCLLAQFPADAQEKKTEMHPIFSGDGWKEIGSDILEFTDPDGTRVAWQKAIYYRHSNSRWFKSERTVFGELVMKAYGEYNQQGKLLNHWVSIEKDGRWYTVRTPNDICPRWISKRNTAGKVVAMSVMLRDGKGKEIVRREVKRKE